MRRTANWQTTVDERILETLRDRGPSTVRMLAGVDVVLATRAQVRERVRYLAGVDLVEYGTGYWADWVELTSDGFAYLTGDCRADLRVRRIDRSLA